jgi:hypothetical protein
MEHIGVTQEKSTINRYTASTLISFWHVFAMLHMGIASRHSAALMNQQARISTWEQMPLTAEDCEGKRVPLRPRKVLLLHFWLLGEHPAVARLRQSASPSIVNHL